MAAHRQLTNAMWTVIMMTVFDLTVGSNPREHKVHNVVLYPDRHAWCDVTEIQQVISHPGCQSKTIQNHVCVGTCFSFSVPKTIPATPGDDNLHYCDSCQPSQSTWTEVTLECDELESNEVDQQMIKSVEVISNCSCNTCAARSLPPADQPPADDDKLPAMLRQQLDDDDYKTDQQVDEADGGGGAPVLGEMDDDDGDDLDTSRFVTTRTEADDHGSVEDDVDDDHTFATSSLFDVTVATISNLDPVVDENFNDVVLKEESKEKSQDSDVVHSITTEQTPISEIDDLTYAVTESTTELPPPKEEMKDIIDDEIETNDSVENRVDSEPYVSVGKTRKVIEKSFQVYDEDV